MLLSMSQGSMGPKGPMLPFDMQSMPNRREERRTKEAEFFFFFLLYRGLNPGPGGFESGALSTEPHARLLNFICSVIFLKSNVAGVGHVTNSGALL